MTILPSRRRVRAFAPVAAAVLTLASCGDSTSPLAFGITTSATAIRAPDFSTADAGQPIIACAVELAANAVGAGGASWDQATFYFYFGKDRSTPFDTSTATPAEVADAWDSERIEAGERWVSGWTFSAGAPFTVKAVFAYRQDVGGKMRTTSTSFDCGPTVMANSPPPVVASLIVEPEAEIAPGQVLRVTYTVQSAVGLWESVVELFGACDTTVVQSEWLAQSATHTASITLPSTCALNQPLGVVVHAVDAALEVTSRQASVTVADYIAPAIEVHFASLIGTPLIGPVAGEFFVGESLRLVLSASDNVGVQKVYWEIVGSGVRDSAAVSGQFADQVVTIPVPSGSGSTIQIRAWSRDVSGLLSIPYLSAVDAIRVHPTVVRPRYSALVEGDVRDFVIDAKRNALYLRQTNESRIAIFSMTTRTVTQLIQPPGSPLDMDLSAGGDSLVMALFGSSALHILDLRDPSSPITSVPLTLLDQAADQRPFEVRVMAGGKAIVLVTGTAANSRRVLEVDLATGAQRFLTAGESPTSGTGMIERSHDLTKLVLGGFGGGTQRYDVTTGTFGPVRTVTGAAWRFSTSVTGNVTASGLNLYGETLEFLRSARVPGGGPGAYSTAVSYDGDFLYTINWNYGVIRSRVSDGAIADRFEVFMNPEIARVSPDGALLVYSTRTYGSSNRIGWSDLR